MESQLQKEPHTSPSSVSQASQASEHSRQLQVQVEGPEPKGPQKPRNGESAVAKQVKTLLVVWASHRGTDSKIWLLHFWSCSILMYLEKQQKTAQVLRSCTHVGDWDEAPGSSLGPGSSPSHCSHLRSEPAGGRPLFVPPSPSITPSTVSQHFNKQKKIINLF